MQSFILVIMICEIKGRLGECDSNPDPTRGRSVSVSEPAWPSSYVASLMPFTVSVHHWMCQPHLCHQVDHLALLLAHVSFSCSFQGGY